MSAIEKQLAIYHMTSNPEMYEVQRKNTFEFVVPNLEDLLRAGANGTEENAYIKDVGEVLRLSIAANPIPHFSQESIQVKRGNMTMKYAGVPTFPEGSFRFRDFIGLNTKEALMAWQNLSFNLDTGAVGSLTSTNYKKDCYLLEYTPDFKTVVRTWKLYGCWISNLSEGPYSYDDGGMNEIEVTIQYDYAKLDLSDLT